MKKAIGARWRADGTGSECKKGTGGAGRAGGSALYGKVEHAPGGEGASQGGDGGSGGRAGRRKGGKN